MKPAADCTLVIKVSTNGWGAFEPGKPAVDHAAEKQLRGGPDWQTVTVSLGDFTPPLPNWRTVTELTLTPAREVVEGRQKRPVASTPWQGPREIRNLRWEGGHFPFRDSQQPSSIAPGIHPEEANPIGPNSGESAPTSAGPRVMKTCGQMGLATGYAATLCKKHGATPREVGQKHIAELRRLIGYEPDAA